MLLAGKVDDEGLKVALTGEGSDEWLAGYPGYEFDRVIGGLGKISGGRLDAGVRKMFFNWLGCSKDAVAYLDRCVTSSGGPHAFQRFYDLLGASRFRFYSAGMLESLDDHDPYASMRGSEPGPTLTPNKPGLQSGQSRFIFRGNC